jgi:hypothetical protein
VKNQIRLSDLQNKGCMTFSHGVLVWWGNLWLESAISAEASGHLSSTLPGGQLGEL